MREDIRERQNSERSLDRLAAQRLLYQQVKSVENWRLALILLVAVLLLAGLALEAGPFSQGATMVVVLLWFIDQVVLVPWAGRKKKKLRRSRKTSTATCWTSRGLITWE